MGLGQHPLEQGGFARAQKTGQDSGGDQHGLLSGDECTKGGSVAIIEVRPKPPTAAQFGAWQPAKRRWEQALLFDDHQALEVLALGKGHRHRVVWGAAHAFTDKAIDSRICTGRGHDFVKQIRADSTRAGIGE